MPVRKPSLEEWFLIHQLDHVAKTHFHLPFTLDVSVTSLRDAYQSLGSTPNWTAILVKASGLLLEKHPVLNRVVFRTVFGDRILEPDYIAVNVPVMINGDGQRHLNAAIVRDAHKKSVDEIRAEIKKSAARTPEQTLVGPYIYGRANTWLNRLRLRALHFVSSNFPSAYEKFGGGGISVSSLMNTFDGISALRIQAYGQTGFTIGVSSIDETTSGAQLRLGLAYDHYAFSGEEAAVFANSLSQVLRGDDIKAFTALLPTRAAHVGSPAPNEGPARTLQS